MHKGQQNFGGGSIRFHPLQKWTKLAKICEKNGKGKERTWVVCSGDVKRMFIGSLADESGWKWMAAKYTRYIPDTNALSVLNTLYTRCIRLHPFYFRATNDV